LFRPVWKEFGASPVIAIIPNFTWALVTNRMDHERKVLLLAANEESLAGNAAANDQATWRSRKFYHEGRSSAKADPQNPRSRSPEHVRFKAIQTISNRFKPKKCEKAHLQPTSERWPRRAFVRPITAYYGSIRAITAKNWNGACGTRTQRPRMTRYEQV